MLKLDIGKVETAPLAALLLYKSKNYEEGNKTVFATQHELEIYKGRPTVGIGRLFRQSDLSMLLNLMNENQPPQNLLPPTVLGYSPQHVTWFVKGRRRLMWFKEGMGIQNNALEVWWPNLIFTVINNTLYVCAYCGPQRPNSKTIVYHAPLMNIYDSTIVCTGNADCPISSGLESLSEWESIVFDTRFSHINESLPLANNLSPNQSTAKHDTAYIRYVKKLAKSGKKILFKDLVPLNLTLEGYMKWLFQE